MAGEQLGRQKDPRHSAGGRPAPARLDAAQQARLSAAIASHQRGEIESAARVYRDILATVPRCFDALNLLGAAAIQQGQLQEGCEFIRRALAVDPTQAHAHSNLSRALLDLGDAAGALGACDAAIRLKPDAPDAWYNRGNALLALKRVEDAAASYRRALSLRAAYPEALNNLSTALRLMHQPGQALESLEACLRLAPGYAHALNNRGLALVDLGRHADAIASYDAALAQAPGLREALNNRGNALMSLKRFDEAAQSFERLALLAPNYMYVYGNLLHARLQCCDWRDHAALREAVMARVAAGALGDFPFSFLCVSDQAQAQLQCARTYTADQYAAPDNRAPPARYHHARPRVAYVSGDFGEHPVSYLMAGVFEAHDQACLETVALSWGRQEEGAIRRRLESAFTRFIDVTERSDAEVAQLMRELEIDIAVDLTGHTRGNRTGIFALRAAPVQVNFLGLPATMGADYIDYLIADRTLVPEGDQPAYAERIVWMPESFQPNDVRRVAPQTVSRSGVGLPATGLVLCSFNNPSKINPVMFDIWMRLLAREQDSVLWLVAPHPVIETNLRREAAARGVDPRRLVFAPRSGYAEYLGRYAHADLFLDSLPFNAGATAGDALSQGVPVLTCAGASFAARMAASLLTTLGLPALVASSLADYEARAIALMADPAALTHLRALLVERRPTHAHFDTDRYRRHLESAYHTMWQRHEAGLMPCAFAVQRLADALAPVAGP